MPDNSNKQRKKRSVKKSNRNSLRRQTITRAYIDFKSDGSGKRALEIIKCTKKNKHISKKNPTESGEQCVAKVVIPDNLTLDTQNVKVWKVEVATLGEINEDIRLRANANQNCIAVVMNFNDCRQSGCSSSTPSSKDLANSIKAMKALAENYGSGKK